MLRRLLVLSVFLSISLPGIVSANVDMQIGYRANFSLFHVDDEVIGMNRTFLVQPFNVFSTGEIRRDLFWTSDLSWKPIKTSTASGGIAQKIAVAEIDFGLDYQWRLSRQFKPRLGVGVGYTNSRYSNRYTTDPDGFLLDRYDDDNKNNFLVYLNASHYWTISREWALGANLRGTLPFNFTAINDTSIGLSGLYHF